MQYNVPLFETKAQLPNGAHALFLPPSLPLPFFVLSFPSKSVVYISKPPLELRGSGHTHYLSRGSIKTRYDISIFLPISGETALQTAL